MGSPSLTLSNGDLSSIGHSKQKSIKIIPIEFGPLRSAPLSPETKDLSDPSPKLVPLRLDKTQTLSFHEKKNSQLSLDTQPLLVKTTSLLSMKKRRHTTTYHIKHTATPLIGLQPTQNKFLNSPIINAFEVLGSVKNMDVNDNTHWDTLLSFPIPDAPLTPVDNTLLFTAISSHAPIMSNTNNHTSLIYSSK